MRGPLSDGPRFSVDTSDRILEEDHPRAISMGCVALHKIAVTRGRSQIRLVMARLLCGAVLVRVR